MKHGTINTIIKAVEIFTCLHNVTPKEMIKTLVSNSDAVVWYNLKNIFLPLEREKDSFLFYVSPFVLYKIVRT